MYARFTLMFKVEERLQEVRMRTDTPTRAKNRATVPTPSEPGLLWALPFSPHGARLQAVGSIPWGREHVAVGNLFRTNLGVQGGYLMSLL